MERTSINAKPRMFCPRHSLASKRSSSLSRMPRARFAASAMYRESTSAASAGSTGATDLGSAGMDSSS